MSATNYKPQARSYRGFTLIEALIVLFIFSLITVVFYQAWVTGVKQIMNAKNRLGATALANEQMEIARSLIFDNIGTTAGVPHGTLPENQTIAVNTMTYTVHTVIGFVDDPTDGTAALETDSAPNDYKKVVITVSWGNKTATEQVRAVSNFSLDGVESVAVGTGVLSINILNNAGEKVSGATVHIVNTDISPGVNTTPSTDSGGNVSFPGAPASMQHYEVTVSKPGYYNTMTYSPYPLSTFNPKNVHLSVVAGSLTPATLMIDQFSTIDFHTKDPFGVDIPNITFSISGGLVIGTDPTSGLSVYDYSQSTTTDGGGGKNLSDRSSGLYTVTLGSSETGYQYLRLTPEENTFGTISLLPNTTSTVHMVLADTTLGSALITVKDSVDSLPIAGATVQLTKSSSSYDETVTTDAYGQAYFPLVATPLLAGTYDVKITAPGFTTKTGTVTATGTQLDKQEFLLSAL